MIDETIEEIRAMRTHSSSVVAVRAAQALSTLLERDFATVEKFIRALERNSDALRRASPSHASLWTTQREIVEGVKAADVESVTAAKHEAESVIEGVIDRVESAKAGAAETAVDRFEREETILTHDYSTTVLTALELAAQAGISITTFVTEARPRYLGRKTVRHLSDIEGIDPQLIVDSAAGFYLDSCDRVLVGMDCIVDDVLYNRIGTYSIAAAADHHDVSVEVIGSSAKLVDGGFRFENDYRSAVEILREPADGFEIKNPAYDATPTRLIDCVITENGVQQF